MGVNNADYDDDGEVDYANQTIEDTSGYSNMQEFTVKAEPSSCPADKATAVLKLTDSADKDHIRVFDQNDSVVIGPDKGATYELPHSDWGSEMTYHAEALNKSKTAHLKLEIQRVDGSVVYSDTLRLETMDVNIVPNYDRDSVIDAADKEMAASKEKFFFWINNDNDKGFDGGTDIPGGSGMLSSKDCRDKNVDETKDLIDLFPVLLNVKQALPTLSAKEDYRYVLRASGTNLRAVIPSDLAPDEARHHLVNRKFGEKHAHARAKKLVKKGLFGLFSRKGLNISRKFLTNLRKGTGGVILLEAIKACKDGELILELRDAHDHVISSSRLPLGLDNVQNMYRHIKLGKTGGRGMDTGTPPNYPDSECNNKNVFFLHGAFVSPEQAPGGHAEVFKRLYATGSAARFWAVSWESDEEKLHTVGPDYHTNVVNAFQLAENFKDKIDNLNISGDKVLMAHSLGNMLACAAIQDHDLKVQDYFMINAAVAMEAFDPLSHDASENKHMVPEDWRGYPSRCWSTHYHNLSCFGEDDDRTKLTWKGRFSQVVPVAHNIYSSGDEVLEPDKTDGPVWTLSDVSLDFWFVLPYPDDTERHVWHKQEMFKGRADGVVRIGVTPWGGWGFNTNMIGQPEYSPQDAKDASAQTLREKPVFRPNPNFLVDDGNIKRSKRNKLLAKAIPALSDAAGQGAIPIKGFDNNYDCNDEGKSGWPRNHPRYKKRWLHNDFVKMAYLYTHKMYEHVVEQGGLK